MTVVGHYASLTQGESALSLPKIFLIGSTFFSFGGMTDYAARQARGGSSSLSELLALISTRKSGSLLPHHIFRAPYFSASARRFFKDKAIHTQHHKTVDRRHKEESSLLRPCKAAREYVLYPSDVEHRERARM